MTVRKTSAFAAERKKPKHGTLDFYPTPAWATEALFNIITPYNTTTGWTLCWEPACGKGHMSEVLRKHFTVIFSSDVKDYGYRTMNFVSNFITEDRIMPRVDWIITNPPFNLAEKFILKALDIAEYGVAIFGRIQLLETVDRYNHIYIKNPPNIVAPFSSRVNLMEGELSNKSGQMMFAWFVWEKDGEDALWNTEPPKIIWIPPRDKTPTQKKMFDKKDAEK